MEPGRADVQPTLVMQAKADGTVGRLVLSAHIGAEIAALGANRVSLELFAVGILEQPDDRRLFAVVTGDVPGEFVGRVGRKRQLIDARRVIESAGLVADQIARLARR